ncbi:peptidoglycan amidohydrolase family protein [Leuconostoc pseudomesenteroides]|nr:peptidoglycan amidohydrolase family protein [Leuconostoc pseudomesenteroides]MDG9733363.1 peptidoglycan amidohydrolase family protein [Leuconostoc pseudomesenteroides]NKZ36490.1 hypothetical protein [Leuconostoc pseudomesenteroides]QQB26836.1 C40 family peptidase [Leuconostoc pseudomesenteroides]
MTYNKETAVNEALSWQHRATYSMQWDLRDGKQADGTTYFDCSAFVYYVLNKAGAWDNSYLKRSHYTGTLKQDLTNAGWVEVDGNHVSKGDVFIWGDNYGAGAGGISHTGLFMDDGDTIIHSSWYTAGKKNEAVVPTNHNSYWALDNKPEYHFFHSTGKSNPTPVNPQPPVNPKTYNDKFRAIGGEFAFTNTTFNVDAVKNINGLWQIADYRTVGGKREQFDWTKNGLPLAIMHRVDNGDNGNVQVGAKVRFDAGWDRGTIDYYQDNSATVGINYSGYGTIWYDSDFAYNM